MTTYKVARYIAEHEIEVQPGGYFWRRSAVKAAESLNAAMLKRNALVEAFSAPLPLWQAFRADVLARALEFAKEETWKAEERAERKRRATEFLDSMNNDRPSVLDDAKPVPPAKTVHWLDEDPIDHEGARYCEPEDTDGGRDVVRKSWGVTEDQWDQAFAGSLAGGTDLPVRIPADEILDATAGMAWEQAEKAWEGVTFVPVQETLLNREENAAADTEQIPAFVPEDVQLSPAMEAFLADAPVTVKRPATRKRPTRKLPTLMVENDDTAV